MTVAAGAIVLVVACGSQSGPNGGATTNTEVTRAELDTLGTEPPDTTEVTRTKDGSTAINVGGARLNGKTDHRNWPFVFALAEDEPKQTWCKVFEISADSSVPITVDVSLSGSRLLRLASDQVSCTYDVGDCRGFTFQPGKKDQACRVEIEASRPASGRAQATVTFTFQSRCPSTSGKPCDDPRVAAESPEPGKPVLVTWTSQQDLVTVVALPCTSDETEWPGTGRICRAVKTTAPETDLSETTRTKTATTNRTTTPPTS
ncbi:hypothetical protein [Saccharothrix sp. NRRL B-16348]|uniref:hypothetical protein n=1 Tax=Saccharothrix sp. NRRL B-16348 TaxID=1415542 RepID=UPI0012FAEE4C|nr:hypothetical protein [Saccharothrix sp. NRRL B-16348]